MKSPQNLAEEISFLRQLVQSFAITISTHPHRMLEIEETRAKLDLIQARAKIDFEKAPTLKREAEKRLADCLAIDSANRMPRTPTTYRSPLEKRERLESELRKLRECVAAIERKLSK